MKRIDQEALCPKGRNAKASPLTLRACLISRFRALSSSKPEGMQFLNSLSGFSANADQAIRIQAGFARDFDTARPTNPEGFALSAQHSRNGMAQAESGKREASNDSAEARPNPPQSSYDSSRSSSSLRQNPDITTNTVLFDSRNSRVRSTAISACLCVCAATYGAWVQNSETSDTETILELPPDQETLTKLFNTGRYEEAIEYAKQGQEFDPWNSDWETIKSKSLVATGQYDDAYQSLQSFVAERVYDLRARLLLREVCILLGFSDEAERQKESLGYLVNERSNRYSYKPDSISAIGDIALLYQVEPKLVLENFYRRAQSYGSQPLSAFLGIGKLALSKDDFKLASKTYQEGLQAYPDNVELWYGLACSYREGDPSKLISHLENALSINPRHSPSRILMAEHYIAAEAYQEAAEQLQQALDTNPRDYSALALKAALFYIQNDNDTADELRNAALESWKSNPQVDYIIGKQLSRKYRFSDGATHQRIALGLDETFNPARLQLAQDLLRLARNDEAWPLANSVYQSDSYNISAYNLVTLRDRLSDFTTLESEHFLIHLQKEEAAVYGQRALRVLENAHQKLSERYQIELPLKTTVEIYAEPADFETRTFGVPGNPGYLGVCFGPVFTINSPSTRSANWEAVLYHEFCHTVTLTLSQNRMPRWLSEGISVYEETVEDPSWGQRMSASYRNRILTGKMQSIRSMSSAFLQAQDGEDIQFAYYQSYLVVEYLAQNYGLQPIQELLIALGDGIEINEALASHLAPIEELEQGFAEFAKHKASQLAENYRFTNQSGMIATLLDPIKDVSDYQAILQEALGLVEQEQWAKVIEILEPLVAEVGYLPGTENAHWPLAIAYRGIEDTESEIRILKSMHQSEASRLGPVLRLHELARESASETELHTWAQAWLAINPMAKTPWRSLLQSASSLDKSSEAIESAKALLALETPDSASLNYQLAILLQDSQPEAAKRHLLMALEEAPRFREAYALYDELKLKSASRKTEQKLEGLDLDYDFLN